MIKRVPGTKDILPKEAVYWQKIEETARNTFSHYCYEEIRTPIIEEAALFNRSLGEFAEIVRKQMFLVKNDSDTYCLRPEATAAIARAYIENNLDKTSGFIKFYYIAAMFRLERPQKGRLRQFHHIGAEAIGTGSPEIDIEIISLANRLLENFRISDYTIQLNSLGCIKDKGELVKTLREEFKGKLKNLCQECNIRFEHNILRILDCKNEACQKAVESIALEDNHLCPDCREHFSLVKSGLDSLGIKYDLMPHLVRGLDYYTRTVFEIKHPDLGAQDALGAGGRYDNLIKELGGPDQGAIGFAFGVERLLLAARNKEQKDSKDLCYIIPLGEKAKAETLKLLDLLRKSGICTDTDYENKSLKGAMRSANDLNAKIVLLLGDNELTKGTAMLKDMASGEQKEINRPDLLNEIKKRLGK